MHAELVSMAPVNSRSVIWCRHRCPRTSSLELGPGEKPLDSRSSPMDLILANAPLVSQPGAGHQ